MNGPLYIPENEDGEEIIRALDSVARRVEQEAEAA